MCPNGSCGRQAQADPKGLLHYNSPPNLGGVARSAGVVRLFGTLNQKYILPMKALPGLGFSLQKHTLT